MTDDLFAPLTGPTPTGARPRPHRHHWYRTLADGTWQHVCTNCSKVRDEAAAKRGRNNRARGLAIQRKANAGLGIANVAGNAPNHDGGKHSDPFASESKSGGAFSERYWRWLKGIPVEAGQIAVLVVTSADGRKARSYVVVDFDDWRDWTGAAIPRARHLGFCSGGEFCHLDDCLCECHHTAQNGGEA